MQKQLCIHKNINGNTSMVETGIYPDNKVLHIFAGWRLLVLGSATKLRGPVVQSVVSLTSSLRVISLTVLAGSIHNILIFFAEKM